MIAGGRTIDMEQTIESQGLKNGTTIILTIKKEASSSQAAEAEEF